MIAMSEFVMANKMLIDAPTLGTRFVFVRGDKVGIRLRSALCGNCAANYLAKSAGRTVPAGASSLCGNRHGFVLREIHPDTPDSSRRHRPRGGARHTRPERDEARRPPAGKPSTIAAPKTQTMATRCHRTVEGSLGRRAFEAEASESSNVENDDRVELEPTANLVPESDGTAVQADPLVSTTRLRAGHVPSRG